MKKLIAIASSDWHINKWKTYNNPIDRLESSFLFIKELLEISHNKNIPILFSGDLFHIPGAITNRLLFEITVFLNWVKDKYPDAHVLGITGNHDMSDGASYINTFSLLFKPLLQCIDNKSISFGDGYKVIGIPFLKHNGGLAEAIEKFGKKDGYKKILLIHTNLYGAKDPNGYEIDEVPNVPRNMGKFFSGYDLVLSGHIHKYDKLWKDRVIMVGAPYHQRTSDSGTTMGYLNVYEDLSTEFIHYKAPEFKFYPEGEPLPDNNNYWIPVPKLNIVKAESEGDFNNKSTKSKLAREYCKVNGVKNKRRKNLLIDTLNKTEE